MKQFYNYLAAALIGIASAYPQCTTPTLSNVSGPGPICSGNTATLSATTNGESIHWFTQPSGGTEVGTGTSFTTGTLNTSTTFYAEAHNGGGSGTAISGGGKLAPNSTGGTQVASASDPWGLAFTATADFVLNSVDVFLTSATPGDMLVYLKDGNYNTLQTLTIPLPAGGTNSNPVQYTVPLNLTITAGNSYKLVTESGPAMIRDLGSNAFPYPIGSVGTITGGTINNANTNSGVYYFFYNWNFTPGSAPCISARQSVTVTVNQTPAAPAAQAQSFCGSGTIAGLAASGSGLKWYNVSTGGTALSGDTALASGNYYVSQSIADCESERTMVAVTVNPIPDAPMAEAQAFCGSGTVAGLQAAGTGLKWYAGETGGSALGAAAQLSSGTYYVSQTVGSCESLRTPVTVMVNDIPEAPGAEAQLFCGSAIVGDLQPNNSGTKWYASENGAPLAASADLATGTYYVTTTTSGCESAMTAVEITVNSVPDAPEAEGNQTLEEGATIADLDVTGENLQWYSDGFMSTELPETTLLEDGHTYYVMQTVNGCPSALIGINVSIILANDNHAITGLLVYPNPVNEVLRISVSQPISKVEVYTLLGQNVIEKALDTEFVQIDVASLAAGTYLLKITAGESTKTVRIAKK